MIRIPWFYEIRSAEADGRPIALHHGTVVLGSDAPRVAIKGRIRRGTPATSFQETVAAYRREYRERYEQFLRKGTVD